MLFTIPLKKEVPSKAGNGKLRTAAKDALASQSPNLTCEGAVSRTLTFCLVISLKDTGLFVCINFSHCVSKKSVWKRSGSVPVQKPQLMRASR